MLEVEVNIERTILDYLNEDCWRAVLQYVPVQDLIRTERASRRWQEMVLTYLQGVRINIERQEWKKKKDPFSTCILEPSEYKSFETWTKKLGASVASVYCISLKSLAMIKENCPNIGALEVCYIESLHSGKHTHNLHDFKMLQQVSFYLCSFSLHLMPKLERLELRGGIMLLGVSKFVAELPRLQHLSVTYDLEREDLEAVLQGFKELRSLELLCCQYMSGFVDVICRHGARLTTLKLAEFRDAKDDDVLRLMQACPALEVLTVAGTRHLSRALPARAAAVSPRRRPRLRLHLGDTNLGYTNLGDTNLGNQYNQQTRRPESSEQHEQMKTKYENLVVVFEKTINEYDGGDQYDQDSDEVMNAGRISPNTSTWMTNLAELKRLRAKLGMAD